MPVNRTREMLAIGHARSVLDHWYPLLPSHVVKKVRGRSRAGHYYNTGEDIYGEFDIVQLLPDLKTLYIQVKSYDSSNCSKARKSILENVVRPLGEFPDAAPLVGGAILDVWGYVRVPGKVGHFKVWSWNWGSEQWDQYTVTDPPSVAKHPSLLAFGSTARDAATISPRDRI